MRNPAKLVTTFSTIALLLGTIAISVPNVAVAADADNGKKIAENRKKGNCFTCHEYKGAHLAGNVGPPFLAMKARFPDKAKLRTQIYDSTRSNPNSMMPPFGRHEILTNKEIDDVTEWVWTL